jgi:hypothetical protein
MHKDAELLNAEQPRADGVQDQRATAANHRAHQAIEGAGSTEHRADDGERREGEHQPGQRGQVHPDQAAGDPPAIQASHPAQLQRPRHRGAGQRDQAVDGGQSDDHLPWWQHRERDQVAGHANHEHQHADEGRGAVLAERVEHAKLQLSQHERLQA